MHAYYACIYVHSMVMHPPSSCAGCAVESIEHRASGDHAAGPALRWPYEGALPSSFPVVLDFHTVETLYAPFSTESPDGYDVDLRMPDDWLANDIYDFPDALPVDMIQGFLPTGDDPRCTTGAEIACCEQQLQTCAMKPAADAHAWIQQRAAAWRTVEALRALSITAIVPCAVLAFVLVSATPLFVRRSNRIVTTALHRVAAVLAGASARAMHAGDALRRGVHEVAQWRGARRRAAGRLLLGGVLPVTLQLAVTVSAVLLKCLATYSEAQRDRCVQDHRLHPGPEHRDPGVCCCCCPPGMASEACACVCNGPQAACPVQQLLDPRPDLKAISINSNDVRRGGTAPPCFCMSTYQCDHHLLLLVHHLFNKLMWAFWSPSQYIGKRAGSCLVLPCAYYSIQLLDTRKHRSRSRAACVQAVTGHRPSRRRVWTWRRDSLQRHCCRCRALGWRCGACAPSMSASSPHGMPFLRNIKTWGRCVRCRRHCDDTPSGHDISGEPRVPSNLGRPSWRATPAHWQADLLCPHACILSMLRLRVKLKWSSCMGG